MNRILYIVSISCFLFLLLFCFVLPYTPIIPKEVEETVFIVQEDGGFLFPPFPPSSTNWFGTDDLGRDIFHQVVLYGQYTILIVFAIVILRLVIAIPLGYLTKNKKGPSYWIMEKMHHYLSGLPILLLAILFINLPMVEASSLRTWWIIIFFVLIETGRLAFIFSNELHNTYKQPFYEASKMTGSTFFYRFKKYDLRHVGPTIVIMFMLELARVMLLLGQLGFLSMFIAQQWFSMEGGGVTIQNRYGTWGTLLADTRQYIQNEAWVPLAPVVAITFAMMTFQLCAEALKRFFSKSLRG